jgi:Na+/melibiose symporter-like transporter
MSNNSEPQKQTEQYFQLWIYFLPVVGIIPSIWTLLNLKDEVIADTQNNPLQNSAELLQQLKASRLSLNLTLLWLGSYALFSWGAADGAEIASFRLLYANAIITTSYFVACTFLMTRLGKKRLFSVD